jgi:hypothetical protein
LEEYNRFAAGRDKMTFLRFTNFKEIKNPKSKPELQKTLGSLNSFRFGKYLSQQATTALV